MSEESVTNGTGQLRFPLDGGMATVMGMAIMSDRKEPLFKIKVTSDWTIAVVFNQDYSMVMFADDHPKSITKRGPMLVRDLVNRNMSAIEGACRRYADKFHKAV